MLCCAASQAVNSQQDALEKFFADGDLRQARDVARRAFRLEEMRGVLALRLGGGAGFGDAACERPGKFSRSSNDPETAGLEWEFP